LCSDSWIVCPEYVSVAVSSSPFTVAPRVSNLNKFDPVR
jgi:hypothetical protein